MSDTPVRDIHADDPTAPDGGENDDVLLPALETIHTLDLNVNAQGGQGLDALAQQGHLE